MQHPLCRAPDCTKPAKKPYGGWCSMHSERLRRHGQLDLPPRTPHVPSGCDVDDCDRIAITRGHCAMHAARIRRSGSTAPPFRSLTPEERFWRGVVVRPDSCWEWTGATNNNGYGVFGIKNSKRYAHRFSYVLHVGPIPDGLELDHLCRNTRCVRPDHLEAVTHAENMRRSTAQGSDHWREQRRVAS